MSDYKEWVPFAIVAGSFAMVPVIVNLVENGNPLTTLGRAKRSRNRAIRNRAAEFVQRGYAADHAMRLAEAELLREAEAQTKALRDVGVEA